MLDIGVSEDFVKAAIRNGAAYSCSTGKIAAAANQAASFFIPNTNTKNILIWSVRIMYSNASLTSDLRYITADDANIVAGTNDATNVLNLKAGGPASVSGFAMHHAAAITPPAAGAGTLPLDEILNAVNGNAEGLSAGMYLVIPPLTAGGIAVYTPTTAAGQWAVTVRIIEF